MKIHYKRYSLSIMVMYLLFFYPIYFNRIGIGGFFRNAQNLLLVVCIFAFAIKASRSKKYVKWLLVDTKLYWIVFCILVMLVSSAVNKILTSDTIKTLLTIVIICLTSVYLYLKKPEKFIYSVETVLTIIILANLLTQILFPTGIYQLGSGLAAGRWLLGQKNQFMPYITVAIIASTIRVTQVQHKLFDIRLVFMYAIGFVSNYLSGSTTSVAVLFFACVAYGMYMLSFRHNFINLKIILPIIAAICIVIVSGEESLIGTLISRYTGKEITFTGRTYIWGKALSSIVSSPFFGNGYMTGDEMAVYFDNNISSAMRSTHNMYLQLLFDGGLVALFFFGGNIINSVKQIVNNRNKNYVFGISVVLVIVLINGLFESTCRTTLFWLGITMVAISSLSNEDDPRRLS